MARNDSKLKSTAIWLGLLFVLALSLRVAFNVGVALDEGPDGDRYLYSGNDPWYHHHTVDHILETGESLTFDPAINYPTGAANPNPPMYDWLTALDAFFLDSMGVEGATSLALNSAVGFWGALMVFPIFMIANQMWGRGTGLWAAFFVAVSAPHIQRGVFGFADHDAITLFFIVLTVAFMLRGLSLLKRKEYVAHWNKNPGAGIRNAVTDNKEAFLWSLLAGVSLAAVALNWKGYPYVVGFMAIAFGLQLLVDHAKNRDSTAVTLLYLAPLIVATLVSLPYYVTLGFINDTVLPTVFAILGMVIMAAILVPTRDLPSIIVFPALFLAGALGLVVILLAIPSVGNAIFTGLGYFQTSKLYSTISEAQRTELGFVAANFGFFTFILSFWYLFRSGRSAFKGDAQNMLLFSWAVLAIFMSFAAGRFVFNAAPVFALLAGAGTAHFMRAAGSSETAKAIRNYARQGNPVTAFFKGLSPKTALGALMVAGILVLPNVWLGVDAAMSFEYEQENDLDRTKLGAFGTSFELTRNGWLPLFDELASRDTGMAIEDKPAFVAWWDYGHWATAIGQHPTLADPFQNNFETSGRFLTAESEEEGMLWLTLELWTAHTGNAAAQQVWRDHGINPSNVHGDFDRMYIVIEDDVNDAFGLYEDMCDATGQCFGYFGADSRMFPSGSGGTGIFYAPVFLANKNPDDFLQYTYSSQNGNLNLVLRQYGVDDEGNSYALDEPEFIDTRGERWELVGGQAYRYGTAPVTGGHSASNPGIPVTPNFQVTGAFANTMYAKAFGSTDANVAAGEGLTHWRVIFEDVTSNGLRNTVLLEYVPGGF